MKAFRFGYENKTQQGHNSHKYIFESTRKIWKVEKYYDNNLIMVLNWISIYFGRIEAIQLHFSK